MLGVSRFGQVFTLISTGVRRLGDKTLRHHKRFGYIGGHHSGNLGDEIMFKCFVQQLKPCRVETLQTPRVEELLAGVGLSGPQYFSNYILGGGTLVNDIWYGKVARLANMGVPMVAIGTGVGSCGKEQSETVEIDNWAEMLASFESVNVRGPLSLQRLERIGVDASICGDVGLTLAKKNRTAGREKDRVAINFIDMPAAHQASRQICDAILPALVAAGYKIDAWVVNDADFRHTKILTSGLADRILRLDSEEDLQEATEDLRFSICTRLHGSVFSAAYGVPTIMIAYRDKCFDFMASIGCEDSCIPLDDEEFIERLRRAVDEHLDDECLSRRTLLLVAEVQAMRDRVASLISSLA